MGGCGEREGGGGSVAGPQSAGPYHDVAPARALCLSVTRNTLSVSNPVTMAATVCGLTLSLLLSALQGAYHFFTYLFYKQTNTPTILN